STAAAPSTVVRSRSAKLTVSLTASVVFAVAVPVRVAAARAARMYLRMAVLLSSDLNRLSSDIQLVLQPYGASHNLFVQVQNSDQAHSGDREARKAGRAPPRRGARHCPSSGFAALSGRQRLRWRYSARPPVPSRRRWQCPCTG